MRPSACPSIVNDPDLTQALHTYVREKLKSDFNITHKVSKKQNGSVPKFPATPGKHRSSSTGPPQRQKSGTAGNQISTVFGRPLRDLVPTTYIAQELEKGHSESEGYEITIPHFLSSIVAYLDRPECLETDGIFRKAGSSARQKKLRQEIEPIQTFDHTALADIDISLSSLDCASILKQWLRELQEPLIPVRFHELLVKCCSLQDPKSKIEAIMLATLLFPPLHSATLTCLIRFLSKVASYSSSNKMDSKSLAIVFTPGLFHASGDEMAKGGVSKSGNDAGTFNMKMAVAEALINNASKVCMLEDSIYDTLQAVNCLSHSEDNIDTIEKRNEDVTGPSARRRKKKKRRSGSLSRVFTAMKGFKNVISSRSATPAGTRCNSSTNIASNDNIYAAAEKCVSINNLSTPDYLRTPGAYYTPIMPSRGVGANANLVSNGKRKGPPLDPLSTTSKQSKGAALSATPLTQPVNRGRSIGLKLKKKKSIGHAESEKLTAANLNDRRLQTGIEGSREKINYSSCTTTPLPTKPTFSSLIRQYPTSSFQVPNTPGTPGSFGVPSAVKDLSGFGSSVECLADIDATSSFNTLEQKRPCTRTNDEKMEASFKTTDSKKLNTSKNQELDTHEKTRKISTNKSFLNHRCTKSPIERVSPANSVKSSKSSICSTGSNNSNRSKVSLKSTASTRSQRRSNGDSAMKIPRSPSERKIGVARRKSQEVLRQSSLREKQREVEKLRNRPGLLASSTIDTKSPGPLKRGKPNTFQVKPSPMKVVAGKKCTGSPSYRIKMSFKEGQIQNPKVIPRVKNGCNSQENEEATNDSVTNLRQDISSIIEQSFGSRNGQSTPSSVSSGNTCISENSVDADDSHSIVGKGIKTLSLNTVSEKNDKINDMTAHFQEVDFLQCSKDNHYSRKMEWFGMTDSSDNQNHNQALRRQSSAFEICRLPSAVAAMEKAKRTNFNPASIRRQSSAFEIRNKNNIGKIEEASGFCTWNEQIREPIYENFDRGNQRVTRASLRNKNSSVKDLVKKLEKVDNISRFEAPTPLLELANNKREKRMSLSTSALPNLKSIHYHDSSKVVHAFDSSISNSFELSKSIGSKQKDPETIETAVEHTDSLEALDQFEFDDGSAMEQWIDAKEFFEQTPGPTKNFMLLSRPDDSIMNSGCKRSSIIRIRTEKKGLVSKSVETFTKPCTRTSMMPPSSFPKTPSKPISSVRHSTANTPQISSRRQSARMGIAGRSSVTPVVSAATSKIHTSSPQASMGVAGAAARRQSIGIRTNNQPYKLESPRQKTKPHSLTNKSETVSAKKKPGTHLPQININEPQYENVSFPEQDICNRLNSRKPSDAGMVDTDIEVKISAIIPENDTALPNDRKISENEPKMSISRKSKRIEERRYLTIGYTGEKVRSPLKEKQNLIATVQRSKSAQTPSKPVKVQTRIDSSNKHKTRRKRFKDSPYTENTYYSENMVNVRRSMSLRSPNPALEIPSSLKETIYDVTTPKSDKVKRNLSDRVVTPGKGGKKETTPYIKTALLSDGKKRTPIKKPAGITQHSRLHQIINQEISSISSKRSNNIMRQYPNNPRVYNYSGASPTLRKSPRIVNLH